jgi:phytoene dehydrogenase-like protein
MAARLIEAIRAHGGELRTRSPVARIRIENGRAAGVELARTGERIDADVVISNADLKRTVLELVGAEHFPPAVVERVRAFRMSLPLFTAYLDLDLDFASLGMPNTNWWIWGSTDLEGIYEELEQGRMPGVPLAYLTAATLKDPTNRHATPPGHTSVQIMTLVPREYASFGVAQGPHETGSNVYHRSPVYRARKAELAERLLATAEQVLPGLREHVVWQESASPLTQERFTHSTGGTSYGIEAACDQIGPLRPGAETAVKGLYLCGASTASGHGIANVLRSGVVAAGEILDLDLLRRIRSGARIGDSSRLPPLHPDWDPVAASR